MSLITTALFAQTWVEQGPSPIINGQDIGLTNPTNPVTGAVNAIAVVPGDPDTVYAGTVNGGIWQTKNATVATPTWIPLTDRALPALSIRSLAISPLDSKLIFAGTGSSSSYSNQGSPGFGVAKSTDGGQNWTIEAASTFTGAAITSIVPTSTSGVLLAATGIQFSSSAKRGLFRSTDDGKKFTKVSSNGASGLPENNVSNIAADPTSSHRFYLAIPDTFTQFGYKGAGVWKSEDDGVTWTQVSTGLVSTNSNVILLSVSKADGTVYAMMCNIDGTMGGFFYSKNQGTSWTQMDVPAATIFPGSQAGDQGAIVAHPTLPGIVFVAGDYHPSTNGCTNFGGNVLRGDTSQPSGSQWVDSVCDGANGTAPHADSRGMTFDTTGKILLQGCDGGLFQLINPDTASTRQWLSFQGDIAPNEVHNIAFDQLSHILMVGSQDTGTSYQTAVGSKTFTDFPTQGDGAYVAVDADQTAHPGTSLRYESYTQLQSFNRHSVGSNNVETANAAVALNIISGPGSGQNLITYDSTRQFNNPFVLNNVNPANMLIGTANIYESLNNGDSLTNLGPAGAQVTSLTYGSRLNGTDYPAAFYVGGGTKIYHRVNPGTAPTVLANYPAGKATVVALVMNPNDYQNVYVLDSNGNVYGSTDEGLTWENHTGDLLSKISQPRTIEVFSPPPSKSDKKDKDFVLIVGGIGDVIYTHPKLHEKVWKAVASGLPHAYFFDIHYNAACDTLVAGSLGRGAWTIDKPFKGGSATDCPALPAALPAAVTQNSVNLAPAHSALPTTVARPPVSFKP